jgi:hypothetical protein
LTANPNPPGSLLVSGLGLKIKTSILVDFMTSLGIQRKNKEFSFATNNVYGLDDDTINTPESASGIIKNQFKIPPLKIVKQVHGLSKSEIKKVVETICLNIVLNSKEYPEVFTLINNFDSGHWNELHKAYLLKKTKDGVIRLGK